MTGQLITETVVADPKDEVGPRCRRGGMSPELVVALAVTLVLSFLLLVLSLNAGPLWRDETNTINIARMPLSELWQNLPFESFPPPYLMLLRGWSSFGFGDTDAGIRLLGFFIGLGFLGSLWACARWIQAPAPTLSLALLGSLPAFFLTVESNRAYGLGMCLLLLTFGLIWRMIQRPLPARIIAAGLVSLLFLHCVYYDLIFLGAMLAGAGLVVARRREWKTLAALLAIGVVGGVTMLPYLPIIQRGTAYVRIAQVPYCDWAHLWNKLNDCLSPTSSGESARSSDFGALVWIGISVIGIAVAIGTNLCARRTSFPVAQSWGPHWRMPSMSADLALFSAITLICGVTGYLLFLLKLQFATQVWYYMEMATLCAVSLEGLLNSILPALRPWGAVRVVLLAAMAVWGGGAVWREAHTRRSNVDLIASELEQKSQRADLIIVQDPWVAITFDRYYHGTARWLTIPAIGCHKVHRTDLVSEAMIGEDPSVFIVKRVRETLQGGHAVWFVGHAGARRGRLPAPPPPPRPGTGWWFEPYGLFWDQQVKEELVGRAMHTSVMVVAASGPVTTLEDVRLLRFQGYQATLSEMR